MSRNIKDLLAASESIVDGFMAANYDDAMEDDLDTDGIVTTDEDEEDFYDDHPEQAVVDKQYDSESSDEAIDKGQDAFESALRDYAMESDDEDIEIDIDEDDLDGDGVDDDIEDSEDAIESILGL